MNLKNAVCIVTGAGTGTGAACATQLSAKGCRVVVNYRRSEQDARNVVEQCNAAGGEAIAVKADVAKDADCRALAQAAIDKWGQINALINNAGVTKFAPAADLEALDAEDFQNIYAVNVIGPYQMIRACAPAIRAGGGGAIVNISSLSGVRGVGSSTAYVASKGALNALTLALARALAPEIRVNAVCPGLIDTRWHSARFNAEDYDKFKAGYEKTVPLEKAASADDVAEVAVWLLEGAALVTGETILVDGGYHLGKT
ncbi:MAG TPA: SDR family oxidoreductase [Burkholderiales bacterium]|nr:SDR family oxidoreductase [Burkholderiales bacterium]